MANRSQYKEELFQWIWQQVEFDCRNLRTTRGKSLHIIDTGLLNHGAGPDFLGAHLRIDDKDWYGSVEIHKKPGEWYQHGHQQDPEYNSVILHVIYEDDGAKRIQTEDNHEPFTFVLKPHLTEKIHRLLEAQQKQGIACSGNISFINQEAFEKQVEKAQREYLEYKVEQLLGYYDPSLPLSTAWTRCLVMGAYRTLGIPSNKIQMERLAQTVFTECQPGQNVLDFAGEIQKLAFQSEKNFHWKFSGMRPASRPELRVKQAALLHNAINEIPFQNFFKNELEETWNKIMACVESPNRPGQLRLSLIKQLVYVPAIYFLGDLLQAGRLKQSALKAWRSPVQHVPEEIEAPFKKAGFVINNSIKVMGLAHQFKRYCRMKNCHQCEVFKKAIRS